MLIDRIDVQHRGKDNRFVTIDAPPTGLTDRQNYKQIENPVGQSPFLVEGVEGE
jgi:hypothetical protein